VVGWLVEKPLITPHNNRQSAPHERPMLMTSDSDEPDGVG